MLAFRSLAFNVAFYINLIAWMLVCLPTLLMPRPAVMWAARNWAKSSVLLLNWIAGTDLVVRGREHLPPGGVLVVSKHQSLWETFALIHLFDDPAYILKRELMWIPFFGWYLWRARMIAIDRGTPQAAIAAMNQRAAAEIRAGRQILIFPEGTRRPPGAAPAYKQGFAHLYEQLQAPILPLALNSGLYWPRRQFIRRPGTVVVEMLEPIPPGLPRAAAFDLARARIEEASNRLLAEGLRDLGAAAPTIPSSPREAA